MSGKKLIYVDEAEWSKLQREASRMRELKRGMKSLVKTVRDQAEADIGRVSKEIGARQQAVEGLVEGLSEQTRSLERNTNRLLREQAEQLDQSLRATTAELGEETHRLIAAQQGEWRSALADERRRRRDEQRQMAGELAELTQDRARAAAAARAWLSDARLMHDLIGATLPHERFRPGALAGLQRRLATAQQNVEDQLYDAALPIAQEAFHELSDLRLELELSEREWRGLQSAAVEALVIMRELIEHNRLLPVRDEKGQDVEGVTLDVDYWSSGGLNDLRDDVAVATGRIRDDTTPPTIEALRAAVEQDAPGFEQRLAELVDRAGMRQLASQLRVNLADLVAQTLDETAGYELVDGSYAGEDFREAFFAKLRHDNGSEIVVDVSPASDGSSGSVLRMLSYDTDTASASERTQRATAITTSLRQRGLNVPDAETEAGEPDNALRDIDALRRAVPGRQAPDEAANRRSD